MLAGWITPEAAGQNDRWIDTPTGWTYLYGATSTQVNNLISGGQRVFNIGRAGSNSYDAVGVTNSGAYAHAGSQVVYGQSFASLSSFLSNAGHRLLDLEAYENGGTENFAAVTVPDSGSTGVPGWGWLYRATPAAINNWITNANPPLRLIDLDVYSLGGTDYYTAVAVQNTGAQQQGWWYYYNQTAAQVTTLLTQNGARLVDIEVDRAPTIQNPTTLFTVIMVADNPGSGWWYPALTTDQINGVLGQTGGRLTCLTRYSNAFGQTRFAVALVDNANAETRRVRDLIAGQMSDGDYGFRVKEVGGPVLASLNEDFAFEPASMLKILHGVYAIDRCASGLDSLTNTLLNDDTCNPDECPANNPGGCSPATETVEQVLQRMLRRSDNNATQEIAQRYGVTNLNNYAAGLGLSNTGLNHTLGCLCSSLPNYNRFSARDAVDLYELVADGSLFSQFWQDRLYGIMNNWQGMGNSRLAGVLDSEMAATNLTTSERNAFRAAMNAANKGGSYGCGPNVWRTDGGWARLPFKTGGPVPLTLYREYSLAIFVNNTTDPDSPDIYDDFWELIRMPIREALQSWDAACAPRTITDQPDDAQAVVGGSAVFSVTTTGVGLGTSYRWYRYIGPGVIALDDIPGRLSGTHTSQLTISAIEPDDAADYRCVVSNDCSSVNSRWATLTVTPGCPADFDNNGVLNFFDVASFINAYNTQSPAADLAAPFGVLNFFDVAAFIGMYNAGCP